MANLSDFLRLGYSRKSRGVAQFGSALDWGSSGRRFKSCRPDHFSFLSKPIRVQKTILSTSLDSNPPNMIFVRVKSNYAIKLTYLPKDELPIILDQRLSINCSPLLAR